jgi:hypothetical protein
MMQAANTRFQGSTEAVASTAEASMAAVGTTRTGVPMKHSLQRHT